MTLNKYGRILFPLIAYSPFFFILLTKYLLLNGVYAICVLFFLLLFEIVFLPQLKLLIMIIEDIKDNSSIIEECWITKSLNTNYLLLIMAYLTPLCFNFDYSVFSIIFLIISIFYIYINRSLITINLLSMIAGYNLYKAIYNNNEILLLSKKKLYLEKNNLRLMEFTKNIYVIREE